MIDFHYCMACEWLNGLRSNFIKFATTKSNLYSVLPKNVEWISKNYVKNQLIFLCACVKLKNNLNGLLVYGTPGVY